MKRLLKRVFFRIAGESLYLKTLKLGFGTAYKLNLLKNDEIYKWHYFVRYLIREGDYVLDLGANLGYYTNIFSDLAGTSGRVFSVEPVKPFYEILVHSLRNKNVVAYNYALGEDRKVVKMSIPYDDGYLRTGLAHIENKSEHSGSNEREFEVEMVRGSELFKDLERLDYLKCDIEGYEEFVLHDLRDLIARLRPLIQMETWAEHKERISTMLAQMNYKQYVLLNGKLTEEFQQDVYPGDFLFIPKEKEGDVLHRIAGF